MVIFLNSSAFWFILSLYKASALNIFKSLSPDVASKKASPIEIYFDQYLANTFLAYFETAIIEIGINGTKQIRATALCQYKPIVIPNKIKVQSLHKRIEVDK